MGRLSPLRFSFLFFFRLAAGVGRALIDTVVEWNRSLGVRVVKLMVTSVSQGAMRFYEEMGFRMTGVTGPYPNDPAIIEFEMEFAVR